MHRTKDLLLFSFLVPFVVAMAVADGGPTFCLFLLLSSLSVARSLGLAVFCFVSRSRSSSSSPLAVACVCVFLSFFPSCVSVLGQSMDCRHVYPLSVQRRMCYAY